MAIEKRCTSISIKSLERVKCDVFRESIGVSNAKNHLQLYSGDFGFKFWRLGYSFMKTSNAQ